ncbi:MAG: amidohydrolase [Desulfobacterales bacterium]|nr:amidohydrolase [Desulfobacterales bacterium]
MCNNQFSSLILLIFIIAGCATGSDIVGTGEKAADTVLLKGQIYTVDNLKSWAEAVAIEDGTIVFVGSTKEISPYIGPQTEIINLKGKFAMPSFVDGHMHPGWSAYTYLYQAALYDLYTTEQYLDKIREFADENPNLKGIMGAGFYRSVFDSNGPKKEWLDEISTEHPIAVTSNDGHSMWVNSKTLEMIGITKDTPDPKGGVIKRDPETGEPSGLLHEYGAMNLVWDIFPAATKAEYKKSLLWLQDWLNAEGITTAHDAWLEFDPNYYEAYQELAEEGKLTVRYRGSWYIEPTDDFMEQIEQGVELAKKFNHPHFKAHSFKFFADQVIEGETAFLVEPYAHRLDYYGQKTWTDEEMVDAFSKVDKAGLQIHVHVIGDGAAKYTVKALEKTQEINGERDSRHSFAHVQMAKPEDVKKMGELGLSAHMSQYWMNIDEYFWDFYLPYLGPERAFNETYPHKSLFDAGVNVTVASDFNVSKPDVMFAIYSGMKRILPIGKYMEWYGYDPKYRYVTNPDAELRKYDMSYLPPASECVSLDEMVAAATINGAYANFLENEVGSIEVGKKADIVVLSKNIFKIDTEEIPNVEIEMTFFEGKRVY